MRIVSQKKMPYTNLPYEEVGIYMDNDEAGTVISAFGLSERRYWPMAHYKTQTSAIKALNDMNNAYVELKKNTDHEGRQQVYKMEKVWRFPDDKEA